MDCAAQGHQLAHRRGGSPVAAPFNRDRKWTPREHAALFCSPPYHCSAQPPPGLRITLFSPQSLLRSGPSPLSAPQAQGPDAEMDEEKKDTIAVVALISLGVILMLVLLALAVGPLMMR